MKKISLIRNMILITGLLVAPTTMSARPTIPPAIRPYVYTVGGIGCVMALPFIYNSLYFKLASQERLKQDAHCLMARIRSRYYNLEQVARSNNRNDVRTLVQRFFENKERYDSAWRRVLCLAPHYDAHAYFTWRTQPYLKQLSSFLENIDDHQLKHELTAVYNALTQVHAQARAAQES